MEAAAVDGGPSEGKSYVSTYSKEYPVQDDLVMYKLFQQARDNGHVGEIINLETDECTTTTQLLDWADGIAKGLLALGLVPDEDVVVAVGVSANSAFALFVAGCSIGIGFAHTYIYTPMETCIVNLLSLIKPKMVLTGEGANSETFDALISLFEESNTESPVSTSLPFVKNIFYDSTYRGRDISKYKHVQLLDTLTEIGKSVSDEELQMAKNNVKPHFTLHHLFTSGSTGKPKCVVHSHRGLANDLLQLRATNLTPCLTMNPNVDEMISYACLAWTLAGQFSKVLMAPDVNSGRPMEDFAKRCADGILQHKVEYLLLPGGIQTMIATHITENNITLHPMKLFLNGAQVVSRGYKEGLKSVFKGIPFTAYGMCETFIQAVTTLGTTQEDEELMLESRLYPKLNTEIRIVDEKNRIVDIGKDGEIQVKTYSVLKEYKTEEQKTRELFTPDGFLRTGDMAVMYPDGTFVIKGRVADAIRFKVFGDVIYPGPIEEVLSLHPDIKDCSVISGRCNDWFGDEIVYCIRLRPGAKEMEEDGLLAFCTENGLDDTHQPARIIYFDQLPTAPNSRKVSKAKLREQVTKLLNENSKHGETNFLANMMKDLKATSKGDS